MRWPEWIDEYPPGFEASLDRLVKTLIDVNSQRNQYPKNKDIADEAEKIDRKTRELLRLIRNFHGRVGVTALDEEKKSGALEFITNQINTTEEQTNLIKVGFSPYSIQWPMMGLSYHMQFIADAHTGIDGRPRKFIESWAIEKLVELATKAGIPLDRKGYKRTFLLFEFLFQNADMEHPGDWLFKKVRKDYKDN